MIRKEERQRWPSRQGNLKIEKMTNKSLYSRLDVSPGGYPGKVSRINGRRNVE
jgi:hypothetical protein